MVDPTVILAGAIPSAVLALTLDGGLTLAERAVRGRLSGRRATAPLESQRPWPSCWLPRRHAAVVASTRSGTVDPVGSKNFTEQILLGELLAQTLEAAWHPRRAPAEPRRHVHLRSRDPFRRHRRLRRVHGHGATRPSSSSRPIPIRDACLDAVRRRYADAGLTVLDPLGLREHVRHPRARRRRRGLGLEDYPGCGGPELRMAGRVRLRIPSARGRLSWACARPTA